MSRRIYAIFISIAALLCAVACSTVFGSAAYAESASTVVKLTRLGEYSDTLSDTVYSYINSPNSVYADALGITVSCESDTVKFAADTFVATQKSFPSNKLFSVDGKDIVLYNGEIYFNVNEVKLDADFSIVDFDIHTDELDSTLYAVDQKGSIVKATVGTDGFDNIQTYTVAGIPGINVNSVAVAGDAVFVAYSSSALPKYKNGIGAFTFDDDTQTEIYLDALIPQVDTVMSLAAIETDGKAMLYLLTAFDISVYKMSADGASIENIYSVDNSAHRLINIAAYNGNEPYIYALDSLSGIIKISRDLSEFKTVIASASDMNGFFNTPSGATVKHSTLYVADTVNGRIAEYGSELEYAPHNYVNPVSVATDTKKTLYVAHNRNTVTIDYADGTRVDIKLPTSAGAIKQIAVNADKTLYILASYGMYCVKGCGDSSVMPQSPQKIENTDGYTAFTLSASSEDIYALSTTSIDKLAFEDNNETLYATADDSFTSPSGAFSIAVDINKNIFVLTTDGLSRIDGSTGENTNYTFTVGNRNTPYTISSGQIILNAVKNEFIRTENSDDEIEIYVNAVIVDSLRHCVFVVDGSDINLRLIDQDYAPPGNHLPEEDTTPNLIVSDSDRIIRVAKDNTPAFTKPVDMESRYSIEKGRKVIVPVNQLDTPKEYYMILVDNLSTGKLMRMYVYKDALSDPLPYSEATTDSITVYNNATPVYKWPSPNSPYVDGYDSLQKGNQLKLISFVYGYTDDYGNKWYRVAIGADSYEGFVLASNVSILGYEPTAIHPAYNATIISYDGNSSAQIYMLDENGKFVTWPDVPSLPAGTRVEVLGAFDSSNEYTKIKFFNAELNASLTCYVRTGHIDYDGVNVVLLIAILVTVVTVILIIVIIARVMYLKKKRLINTVYEDDE